VGRVALLWSLLMLVACADVGLSDFDGDGAPDSEDCDPADPELNEADVDGDGFSTCDGDCDDADVALTPVDGDGDGRSTCEGDCDDSDPSLVPGGSELCNGRDDDCDPATEAAGGEWDADVDGDLSCSDCDDSDPARRTLDLDGDGVDTCVDPPDCDDADATRYPGAPDPWGDDIDQNCDELDGVDADEDGVAAGNGGDCDDGEPTVFEGAPELCDGLDNDCDDETAAPGELDSDADGTLDCVDGDGDGVSLYDGDCDDSDASLTPVDEDGDGFSSCAGDCDEEDDSVHPDAPEQCNSADDDCDGDIDEGTGVDTDGDGQFACQGDCDDGDPLVWDGAPELCDGVLNDCGGVLSSDEEDDDGDTFRICAGDCDDGSIYASPAGVEVVDGEDNDCDGSVDGVDALTCAVWVTPTDSVQDGIDAASADEVVCLEAGTWAEEVGLNEYELTLVGVAGRELTVIDAGSALTSFVVSGFQTEATVVEGLTFTGGLQGVRVEGTAPTLRRLRILDSAGRGLTVQDGSPVIEDVEISGHLGGGVHVWTGEPTLLRVQILDNVAEGWGGGLLIWGHSGPTAVTVSQSIVAGNVSGADVTTTENVGRGGGVHINASELSMDHTLVYGNDATETSAASVATWAGGLSFDDATIVLSRVMVYGNLCTASPCGMRLAGGSFDGDRLLVTDNGPSGASVQMDSATDVTFTGSILTGSVGLAGGSPAPSLGWCALWRANGDAVVGAVGVDGNIDADPGWLDAANPDLDLRDYHLGASSDLVDAGEVPDVDPDGSPSDIGPYSGPDADGWDLDGDGAPGWWQPGPYDVGSYPALGWDCDDRDATVFPGQGC